MSHAETHDHNHGLHHGYEAAHGHGDHAEGPKVYGVVAEFHDPHAILHAAEAAYAQGFRMMDAYTPVPVHGLAEAIGFSHNRLPLIVLLGGLAGGIGGFCMQYFATVIHYPIIIGGRPFNSWPSYIPITFELTVLAAAFAAVFGMLGLNGLPRLHHPIFNAPNFALASRDRFFLCIQSNDPKFDVEATGDFLRGLGPQDVSVVQF